MEILALLIGAGALFMAAKSRESERKWGRPDLEKLAETAALKHGIAPSLLKSIIGVESKWNAGAFNPEDGSKSAYVPGGKYDSTGSFGLCQVRGLIAKALKKAYPSLPELTPTTGQALLNPAVNVEYAARLLRELQDNLKTTDYRVLAVAYNGGQDAGKALLGGVTPANIAYAQKVGKYLLG